MEGDQRGEDELSAMTGRLHFDEVMKDVFQRDRPTLLTNLAEGHKIREFLNPEFAVVEKRVADLLILLSDGSILHLDFQSSNDRNMAYREGIYALMAAQKYRRPVRQVVIYLGKARMHMPRSLDTGGVQVNYRLIDIRELDSQAMLESGAPGDYALALLARGGVERMKQIVARANQLPEPKRRRVLTQMLILSGLRGVSEQLTMEYRAMGISIEIKDNVFLKDVYASGKAEGKAEGMTAILREQLEIKFGALPRWAQDRLRKATPAQAERWARKMLTASSVEAVLGPR